MKASRGKTRRPSELGLRRWSTKRTHANVLDQSSNVFREILQHQPTSRGGLRCPKVGEEGRTSGDDGSEVRGRDLEDVGDLEEKEIVSALFSRSRREYGILTLSAASGKR